MDRLRLVLASASPRRRELLGRLDLAFSVEPAEIDESTRPGEVASDYVCRLARSKAAAMARPGTIVIGADTAVVLDGIILGKPTDPADNAAMLRQLAGRSHEVITGIAVMATADTGRDHETHGTERSTVTFDAVSDARIAWYTNSAEPADKAGGYALQGAGALFADRVDGSVSNVIGLPLPLLDRLCSELGVDLLSFRRDGG